MRIATRWVSKLRKLDGMLRQDKFKPTFKHRKRYVPVHKLAEQFFCEMKVEQGYLNPEIEITEAKANGIKIHDRMIPTKVTLEKIIEGILSKSRFVASFTIGALVGKLRIVGKPDAIVFENAKPIYVIEIKTVLKNPKEVWLDEVVQARIYGLLLDRMGFDCSNLKIVVAKVIQNVIDAERMLHDIINDLGVHDEGSYHIKNRSLHCFEYAKATAEKDVLKMQDYWTNKRAPLQTNWTSRCRVCGYRDICPRSLASLTVNS